MPLEPEPSTHFSIQLFISLPLPMLVAEDGGQAGLRGIKPVIKPVHPVPKKTVAGRNKY